MSSKVFVKESVDRFTRFAAKFATQLAAVLVIENKLAARCGQIPCGGVMFHATIQIAFHFFSPPDIYSIAENPGEVNRFT